MPKAKDGDLWRQVDLHTLGVVFFAPNGLARAASFPFGQHRGSLSIMRNRFAVR